MSFYPICPSALLKLLLAELEGIELVVAPLQVEKLLMGALLHDLAVGQQNNVVRMLDGGQPVGNDQQRLAPHQLCQGGLDDCLVFRIGVGGSFVPISTTSANPHKTGTFQKSKDN